MPAPHRVRVTSRIVRRASVPGQRGRPPQRRKPGGRFLGRGRTTRSPARGTAPGTAEAEYRNAIPLSPFLMTHKATFTSRSTYSVTKQITPASSFTATSRCPKARTRPRCPAARDLLLPEVALLVERHAVAPASRTQPCVQDDNGTSTPAHARRATAPRAGGRATRVDGSGSSWLLVGHAVTTVRTAAGWSRGRRVVSPRSGRDEVAGVLAQRGVGRVDDGHRSGKSSRVARSE